MGREAGQFKKGNPGKPKGAVSEKTRVKHEIMTMLGISDIKNHMNTGGYSTMINDIQRLKPKDRVQAYLALMEYVEPKLARREIVTDKPQQIINIFGKTSEDSVDITDNCEVIE